jgi:hypothetical protein
MRLDGRAKVDSAPGSREHGMHGITADDLFPFHSIVTVRCRRSEYARDIHVVLLLR